MALAEKETDTMASTENHYAATDLIVAISEASWAARKRQGVPFGIDINDAEPAFIADVRAAVASSRLGEFSAVQCIRENIRGGHALANLLTA